MSRLVAPTTHHDSTRSETDGPVLLLTRTGFIIRNLLLGTFARTIAAERRLVVALPVPDDPRLLDLLPDRSIRLINFPEEPPPASDRLTRLRSAHTFMYRFKEAEKSTRSLQIQTRLFESRQSRLANLGNSALRSGGRVLRSLGWMGEVERRYLNAIERREVTGKWTDLLDSVRPSVVVSTMLTHSTLSQSSCDLPAVLAAYRLGIPCGTLVQSWDNLSSKTSILPPWLDRVWTWSDAMTREALRLNPRVPAQSMCVVGAPQFDFHLDPAMVEPRGPFLKRLGLDPERPVVVVGTGTPIWMPGEPLTVVDLAARLRRHLPECQLLIRLHPKDMSDRWDVFREKLDALGVVFQHTAPELHMDLGGFIPPRDFYREQVSTLMHAAVVLNTASTLTVDAAILDRPVICFGYDCELDPQFPEGRSWAFANSSHFQPLVETGGVRVVRSAEDCLRAIRDYLDDPRSDQEGRRKIVEMVTGRAVGRAGLRLAREVLEMAESKSSPGPRP